jgi:hypothetical protein
MQINQAQPAVQIDVEKQNTVNNALVLANIGEVVAGVIKEVAGNDIATSLNGDRATSEVVQLVVYQRLQSNLTRKAL